MVAVSQMCGVLNEQIQIQGEHPFLKPHDCCYRYERSNLHLIEWAYVLLDHHNQYHHVRCGTARGDSISQLNIRSTGRKISIIDRIDDEAYWKSSAGSVLLDIGQLLKLPSYQMKTCTFQFN